MVQVRGVPAIKWRPSKYYLVDDTLGAGKPRPYTAVQYVQTSLPTSVQGLTAPFVKVCYDFGREQANF